MKRCLSQMRPDGRVPILVFTSHEIPLACRLPFTHTFSLRMMMMMRMVMVMVFMKICLNWKKECWGNFVCLSTTGDSSGLKWVWRMYKFEYCIFPILGEKQFYEIIRSLSSNIKKVSLIPLNVKSIGWSAVISAIIQRPKNCPKYSMP